MTRINSMWAAALPPPLKFNPEKKEVTHTLNLNHCIIKTNEKGTLIYFIVNDDRCSWFYIGNDFTKKTKWKMNSYFRA